MEKKTSLNSTTSKPEHHAVSPADKVHKGVKLVPNPKKQVKFNPQHVSDVKESAVAVNRKFEDFLFEQHVKSKLTKPIAESLVKKSHKSSIPLQILEQVFSRGVSSWNPYVCKNASQEQWAFARVNSFIAGGKATELDEDLLEASRTFRSAETAERQSTDPNSPMSRLDGTKQARKTFAKQTPGQLAKEEVLSELEGFGKKILDHKRSGDTSPCWTGYVQKGTKLKGGKVVPNCVKINEDCAIDEASKVYVDDKEYVKRKVKITKKKRTLVKESKDDDHILVVHGGSNFDHIDLSHSGRGEPGNIRPLGKGLYGYHIPHDNEKMAHAAIEGAKHYANKYGRGEKHLHVFKIPKTATASWNGPVHLKGFQSSNTPEEHAWLHAAGEADKIPVGPERNAAYSKVHELGAIARKNPGKPQIRGEHLPGGSTEIAIHDPSVAPKIAKYHINTPTHEILKDLKGK